MKKRVDWQSYANKAIYASAFVILVFAFAMALQGPLEEQPLGAPIIETASRGTVSPITEEQTLKYTFERVVPKTIGDKAISLIGSILDMILNPKEAYASGDSDSSPTIKILKAENEQGSVEGTFYFYEKEKVTKFTTSVNINAGKYPEEIMGELLRENYILYMPKLTSDERIYGRKIIRDNAVAIWGDRLLLKEAYRLDDKKLIKTLRTSIIQLIAKVEKKYGDVFKEDILKNL